jgi:hypothetical protein
MINPTKGGNQNDQDTVGDSNGWIDSWTSGINLCRAFYPAQARINQGIRSGDLTSCEFRYLEREQAAIEAHRRMAWSDGKLSPWEARHLAREQDRVSHDIWRAKHNAYHAW